MGSSIGEAGTLGWVPVHDGEAEACVLLVDESHLPPLEHGLEVRQSEREGCRGKVVGAD